MLLLILMGIAVWVVCGVFTYGFTFAYFQRKWPRLAAQYYSSDRKFAVAIGLTGPFGLLGAFIGAGGTYQYGLKWR
jgi:hypothetical protein